MEEEIFYKEEMRCGWKVDQKTKRVWAVQLEMLDEVERICKKHGLKYFADSGTLIGAVRHQGYIPWDDDIDLVMLREDYEAFIRIAPGELRKPLALQTLYAEKNYLRAHAQIRNSQTTGCSKEDRKAGYNCGIFIDIFPLDAMPEGKLASRPCGRSCIPGIVLITMTMRLYLEGCCTSWEICFTSPWSVLLQCMKGFAAVLTGKIPAASAIRSLSASWKKIHGTASGLRKWSIFHLKTA